MILFTPHYDTSPFTFNFASVKAINSKFPFLKTSTTSSLFAVPFIPLTFHEPRLLTICAAPHSLSLSLSSLSLSLIYSPIFFLPPLPSSTSSSYIFLLLLLHFQTSKGTLDSSKINLSITYLLYET